MSTCLWCDSKGKRVPWYAKLFGKKCDKTTVCYNSPKVYGFYEGTHLIEYYLFRHKQYIYKVY